MKLVHSAYLALVLLLAPGNTAGAQCTDSLCAAFSENGRIDYVVTTSTGITGTVTVSGIPPDATVRSAWLYFGTYGGWLATGASFAGNILTLNQVGFANGTSGKSGRSFRQDVTKWVPGDGSYSYTVTTPASHGVALLVIYEDCNNITADYQIELHDGYHPGVWLDATDGSWPNATVFSGFTVDGTVAPHAELGFFVMGGIPGWLEEYFFQGTSIACCDPAISLVEWEEYDVSSFYAGGETSGTLDIWEHGNAIGLMCAFLRVRTGAPGAAPPPPVNYCTAGTSASLCQATLSATGTASATATSGFTLSATNVEGDKAGLFYFGTNGRQANPWGNGSSSQCVVPPVIRGGMLTKVGAPDTCTGTFSQDLNALWCASCPKPLKNPGAGSLVRAQLWYRDPDNTSNQTTSLSDAIEFCVGP